MHQVSDLARIGYPASTRPDPTSRWLLPRSVEGRSLHVVGGCRRADMDPRQRLQELEVSLNSGFASANSSEVRRTLNGLTELASQAADVSSEAAKLASSAQKRLEADSLVAECGEADPFKPAYIFYQDGMAYFRCTHDKAHDGPHTWPA